MARFGFPVKNSLLKSVWGLSEAHLGAKNQDSGGRFFPKCFVGLILLLGPPPGLFNPYKTQQMVAIKATLYNFYTHQIPQNTVKAPESENRGVPGGSKPPPKVTQSVETTPNRSARHSAAEDG